MNAFSFASSLFCFCCLTCPLIPDDTRPRILCHGLPAPFNFSRRGKDGETATSCRSTMTGSNNACLHNYRSMMRNRTWF
ncbi:uncharacterized protein P884DRAFT_107563 [Thermothelomyces heterothallicus CBS 202.75]|uniref:uncharacterized protein n=1 Tax=Thermothelomyces heterothallicus CBS 202.75 TaxID=1149848 RepID=UPI0037435B74